MPELSPIQDQVIALLSTGSTFSAAAEAAGVHRNTIHHWRRTVPAFTKALTSAQYDRSLYFRDLAEANAELAISTIHDLLADPDTPPSVRLRAALAVLKQCAEPVPPEPKTVFAVQPMTFQELEQHALEAAAETQKPAIMHKVHNFAQFAQPSAPAATGRNAPCPCKSGRKYKQCCLNKSSLAAA